MSDYDEFNEVNKRKEVVGRNAYFVLLVYQEKLEYFVW